MICMGTVYSHEVCILCPNNSNIFSGGFSFAVLVGLCFPCLAV